MTATAILTFLILFGLVLFVCIRYGIVAAIGVAVAIILGRKAAKHIIAKASNQTGRSGDNTHRLRTPPNKRVEASVNSSASF